MAEIVYLIGLPGSGKSTWAEAYVRKNPNTFVYSTDRLIDAFAAERGMTYSEAFGKVSFAKMKAQLEQELRSAIAAGANIIVDQTNVDRHARQRFLHITKGYRRVGVFFDTPSDVLQRRLADRAAATGKHISDEIVQKFKDRLSIPGKDEFDELIIVRP